MNWVFLLCNVGSQLGDRREGGHRDVLQQQRGNTDEGSVELLLGNSGSPIHYRLLFKEPPTLLQNRVRLHTKLQKDKSCMLVVIQFSTKPPKSHNNLKRCRIILLPFLNQRLKKHRVGICLFIYPEENLSFFQKALQMQWHITGGTCIATPLFSVLHRIGWYNQYTVQSHQPVQSAIVSGILLGDSIQSVCLVSTRAKRTGWLNFMSQARAHTKICLFVCVGEVCAGKEARVSNRRIVRSYAHISFTTSSSSMIALASSVD